MQVTYGGQDVFNALVSGEQHPTNIDYFQRQIENVSNTLTNIGKDFYSNVNDLYEKFNGSEAVRLARDALRTVKGVFIQNRIQSLFDLNSFQNAPVIMQRWVMANPVVREVYHKQKCEGYGDSYVDMAPGIIGEQHYDYRRVMDGVIQEDDDTWFARFYPDEILYGDRELNHDDKVNILSSWSIAEMFMKAGKDDPTSYSGGML